MALVLSIALWSHVRGEVNPWEKKVFSVRLPHNPPARMMLVNEAALPATVTVTLRGPRHTLAEIKGGGLPEALPLNDVSTVVNGDISAQFDYSNVHSGQQMVPVKIKVAPSIEDLVDVVDWKPRTVNLALDQATSARFLVQPQFTLNSTSGYRVENVTLMPDSVELSGPSNSLGRVAKVRAQVKPQGLALDTTRTVRAPIVALDADGQAVQGISIEPEEAQVTATLLENLITRKMRVAATWQGTPAAGYHVTDIEILPPRVTVRGPQRVLDKMASITAPLNLEGVTTTVSRRVAVALPAGVTPVGARQVLVRIHIARAVLNEPSPAISSQNADHAPARQTSDQPAKDAKADTAASATGRGADESAAPHEQAAPSAGAAALPPPAGNR